MSGLCYADDFDREVGARAHCLVEVVRDQKER